MNRMTRVARMTAGVILLNVFGVFNACAGLRAAWEFNTEDLSGSTVAASGGSAANTAGTLEADADVAEGWLSLDGAGDYLKFGNNVTGLRALSAMTLSVWVRAADSSTVMRRIFEHEDNIYFWQEGGKYRFTIHGSSAAGTAISTTAPKAGSWQHVLVTYQAGQPAGIYINGVWEANSSGNLVAMPNNVQTLQIGARRSGSGAPSDFYNGKIDDVAVWDTILSLAQIEALAGRGTGGYTGRVHPTAIDDFVVTRLATAIGRNEATLNGTLVSTSSVPAEVRVYWGAADGGTDAAAWANTNYFGTVSPGLLSTNISGLTADTGYFYRYYAANTQGGHWASSTLSFKTYRYLPDDFAGLQLWLRPDAGVYSDAGITPAESSTAVAQWNDRSGNGRHATRVGTSGNLTLENFALGGMPVVRVSDKDGGDYLQTLAYAVADTNDLTVFVVSRADPQTLNGSAIHQLVGSGSPLNGGGAFSIATMRPNLGGPGNLGYFGRSYNPFPYDEYTSNDLTPNFGDGGGHVIALQLSGAASGNGTFTGYYDGQVKEVHNGVSSNPANGPVEIGGAAYHSSVRYAGVFGDILIYDRVLSDDERNRVGWYLQHKYALAGGYRNPFAALISSTAATAVLESSATLNGELQDGDLPAAVTLYWGTVDGGTNAAAWAHTNLFGEVSDFGLLSTNLTGLSAESRYYYRYFGSNTQGGSWSPDTMSFVTWRYLPDDIAGLQLWLKADDGVYSDSGTTPATNGAAVEQWNDFSGSSRNAARIGSTGNLTYERNALGGMPVIRVTDANGGDYLRTAGYQVADTDDLTVFVVSRADPQSFNGSAIHPLVGSGNPSSGGSAFTISTMRPNAGGPGNLGYFGRGYNPYPYDEYTSNSVTPNFGDGAGHVIVLGLAGASTGGSGTFTGYYDGQITEVHNGVSSNPANGPVEIGGSSTAGDRRYKGVFGDILIYNRLLTDEERNQVGWYLQVKYALDGSYLNPFAVVISTDGATDVQQSSATLNGELLNGDLPADVRVYWGEVDGGTDAAAWAHTNLFGSVGAYGALSTNITGLLPGTIYYCRLFGSNSQGGVWSPASRSFITQGPPIVSSDAPNSVNFTSATLRGTLIATSGAPAQVWVYWGTGDGTTNANAWSESPVAFGTVDAGALSTELTALLENTTYYYRFYAQNSYGGRWASVSQSFTTPSIPEIRTDGLVLWLRADAGVTDSGGAVDSWLDVAAELGGANSAAGAGASRPLLLADGIGGRPALQFDGIDDFLSVADDDALDLGIGAGKGWTLITVYQRSGGSSTQDIISKFGGSSLSTDWRFFTQSGSLLWGTGSSGDPAAWMSIAEPAAGPHIITGTLQQTGESSGSKTLSVDGTQVAAGSYTLKAAANTNPVTIGGSSPSSGNMQGLIAEILVYNYLLSERSVNNVGWYLQQKYGISGSYEYMAPAGTVILVR